MVFDIKCQFKKSVPLPGKGIDGAFLAYFVRYHIKNRPNSCHLMGTPTPTQRGCKLVVAIIVSCDNWRKVPHTKPGSPDKYQNMF